MKRRKVPAVPAEVARARLVVAGMLTGDGGLVGLEKENPDAALLAAIADAWRFEREYRRPASREAGLLAGMTYLENETKIARIQPKTILGLEAKAEFALRGWGRSKSEGRYSGVDSLALSALEQAMCILASMRRD